MTPGGAPAGAGGAAADVTGAVARFVSGTRFEDLDRETVEHLKRLVLDGVANAVGGLRTTASRIQSGIVAGAGAGAGAGSGTAGSSGRGPGAGAGSAFGAGLGSGRGSGCGARVLGSGERASVLTASYVNAACANALDFDDTYKTFLHPGATAVPPSLALAEQLSAHGRDLLTAVAVGYEVPVRLAEAAFPSPERLRQVWGFAPWQSLGAAASAASLLRLGTEDVRHALGAAAFHAPVPSIRKLGLATEDRPLSWTKNNYGWAAMGGVLGALLAAEGFRSSRTVLDGDRGFWVMAGSDRYEPELVTADLGRVFRLGATRLKPYASCRWTHSALDCVRRLRHDGELPAPVDVGAIEVDTFGELAADFAGPAPEDVVDAQFSLPYLLALELCGRSPARGLDERDLGDPAVLALAARVVVRHDEAMDAPFHAGHMPARVRVRRRDRAGRGVGAAVSDPVWGEPGDPFTDDDLTAKCTALLDPVWGRAATERLIDGVLRLEQVDDVAAILPPLPSGRDER